MSKTLMEALEEAGYPREQMFNHYSDLYVFASQKTLDVIIKWFKQQGYNWTLFVKSFEDQVAGRKMYDIAFQYTPYWDEKIAQAAREWNEKTANAAHKEPQEHTGAF